MIKSVPIYDIDDSSIVVNTDDFWWWSWLWAVNSVNWQTWTVVLNQDNILDWTTAKQYTATEKTKLSWIQSWATANSTDVQLRDRTTHTWVQAISTITNLQTTLDWKANLSWATFSWAISATNLSNTNTWDQTSIVWITWTKTQFNTSLTDWDFVFTSDIWVSIQWYNANTTTLWNTTTWSGSIVLANSPTLTTPILWTPASWTLTNCTGLTEWWLTLADNTTNNVSTTKHWFAPKLPWNTTTFLRWDWTYAVPPSGWGWSSLLDIIYCDNLISWRIKIQPVRASISVSSTDFYIKERPIGSDIIVKIYKNWTEIVSQNITPTGWTLTNWYYIFNNTTAFSVVSTDILDYKITQVGSSFAWYDLMITSI